MIHTKFAQVRIHEKRYMIAYNKMKKIKDLAEKIIKAYERNS